MNVKKITQRKSKLANFSFRFITSDIYKNIYLNSLMMNNSLTHFPTTVKFLIKDFLTVYFLKNPNRTQWGFFVCFLGFFFQH